MPYPTLETAQSDYVAFLKNLCGKYSLAPLFIQSLTHEEWTEERARLVGRREQYEKQEEKQNLRYYIRLPGRVAGIEIDADVLKRICQSFVNIAALNIKTPVDFLELLDETHLRALELAQMILGDSYEPI